MKKINPIMILTIIALIMPVAYARVVGQDSLESHALGSDLHFAVPEVGPYWIDYIQQWQLSWTSGAVSDDYAFGGTKSVRLLRDFDPQGGSKYPYLTLFGSTAVDDLATYNGDDFIFTIAWYAERVNFDRPAVMFDFGNPSGIGGVNVDLYNEIKLYDGSSYLSTGITAQYGQWHEFEFVLHAGADADSHTYDAYVTIDGGPRIMLGEDIATGSRVLNEYANGRITLSLDYPSDEISATSYFDELLIQKVPQAVCGDQAHAYPVGDFTQDCIVDLNDFALLAGNWLVCTDIDCP